MEEIKEFVSCQNVFHSQINPVRKRPLKVPTYNVLDDKWKEKTYMGEI